MVALDTAIRPSVDIDIDIDEMQFGFVPDRDTVDNISLLVSSG